jgi:hypothetical protein
MFYCFTVANSFTNQDTQRKQKEKKKVSCFGTVTLRPPAPACARLRPPAPACARLRPPAPACARVYLAHVYLTLAYFDLTYSQ